MKNGHDSCDADRLLATSTASEPASDLRAALKAPGRRVLTGLLPAVFIAAPTLSAAAAQEFDPPIPITSGYRSFLAPAVLDVDGDGDLDLVGVDRDEGVVFAHPRVVEQRFDPARALELSFPAGFIPHAVGANDADSDGDADLFVITVGPGVTTQLFVFEQVSGSGIAPNPMEVHPLEGGSRLGDQMNFRDLDGDGVTDILLDYSLSGTSFRGPLLFAFRRSSGFQSTYVDGSPLIDTFGAGDLTGNGLVDVAYVSGIQVYLRLQTSPGVFGSPVLIVAQTGGSGPTQVLTTDLEGDGDLDLIVANINAPNLVTYENLGGGSFGPEEDLFPCNGPFSPCPVGRLDFFDADNDGDLDLVETSRSQRAEVSWRERLGGRQFAANEEFIASGRLITDGGRSATLVDVTDDGIVDVLFQTIDGFEVLVGQDQPAGVRFIDGPIVPYGVPTITTSAVATLDFDGDGDLDVAFSSTRTDELWLAINLGPGRFDVPVPIENVPGDNRYVSTGDLDGDGDDDLVYYKNRRLYWAENLGNSQLRQHQLHTGDETGPPSPLLVDFDGDGDLDIIGRTGSTRTLLLHEQTAPGTFAIAAPILTASGGIQGIAMYDYDGDGDLDMATGERSTGVPRQVRLLEQTAPRFFVERRVISATRPETTSVAWIDVTGDGARELVWVDLTSRDVVALTASSQGGIGTPFVVASVGGIPVSIVDLPSSTTSGRDLALGTRGGGPGGRDSIEYLRWSGRGGYEPAVVITHDVPNPRSIEAADLDLDGDLDLLTGVNVFWVPSSLIPTFGDPGCSTAVPNSTGRVAGLVATGSPLIANGSMTLVVTDMPANSLVTLLCSLTPGNVPAAGGFLGTLCLGGQIGRFYGPGQPGFSNAEGRRDLTLDLVSFPQPTGSVPVLVGQRWYFQGWHRDSVGGSPVSNFTASTSVLFE